MSFERTVEGTIDLINRQAKTLRITQDKRHCEVKADGEALEGFR